MSLVTATRLIHASPETVWALIADVTTVGAWHPSVKTADLLSPEPTGLGATRRCNFYDGTSVIETVTGVEEGRSVHFELSEFSLPMARFEAELTLTATPNGTSQLTFVLDYDLKYGVLGSLMNLLAVRGQMSKLMNNVLAGLDHHLKTGEEIGEGWLAAA